MTPDPRNGPMERDISEVIVFHPTVPATAIKARSPKPRAFVLPVVRPAPPRPAATGSAGTW
jgi:hypothetical protein